VTELPIAAARVLAVGAHPDDLEFFAGGVLAAYAEAGSRVTLVICTDGGRGGRGLERAADVRRAEQAEAARRIGAADVAMLGLPDGELGESVAPAALRDRLLEQVRRTRAELVLAHDPATLWTRVGDRVDLGHSDHRAAGQALLDAIYPRAASPNFAAGLGLAPWCPREVWLFDTARPDLAIDVSASFARKLHALEAHASQESVAGGLTRAATDRARAAGGGGERLAESFVRLRIW
jgi:LmbE family N-acetylglucosaminyl deacetylase